MITADQIIEMFGMKPLKAEGGYYVETYRSAELIPRENLPDRYAADRPFGSAILYLLTPDTFSRLHRLKSDEIFHFYLGDPVTMLQLRPDGSHDVITLGQDIKAGQRLQVTVPQGTWQGCFLKHSNRTPPVIPQSALPVIPQSALPVIPQSALPVIPSEVEESVQTPSRSDSSFQSRLLSESLNDPGRFALMGTTVAPAFDFKDFEPAERKTLLKKYPAQKDLILRLTENR